MIYSIMSFNIVMEKYYKVAPTIIVKFLIENFLFSLFIINIFQVTALDFIIQRTFSNTKQLRFNALTEG